MLWNSPLAISQNLTQITTVGSEELHTIAQTDPNLFKRILRTAPNRELLRQALQIKDATGQTAYLVFCLNPKAQLAPLPLHTETWLAEVLLTPDNTGKSPLTAVWGTKTLPQLVTAPFAEETVFNKLVELTQQVPPNPHDWAWLQEIQLKQTLAKLERVGWGQLTPKEQANLSLQTMAGQSGVEILLKERKLHLIPDTAPWDQILQVKNRQKETVLHIAATLPASEQLAGLPLAHITEPLLLSKNSAGVNILHLAAQAGTLHLFQTLPKFEEYVTNMRDDYGKTPLHTAIKANNYQNLSPHLLLKQTPSTKAQLGHPAIPRERQAITYLHTILLYKDTRESISLDQLFPIYEQLKTAAEDLLLTVEAKPYQPIFSEVSADDIKAVCIASARYYVQRQVEAQKKKLSR